MWIFSQNCRRFGNLTTRRLFSVWLSLLGLNSSRVSHTPLPAVIFHTERTVYRYLSSVWVGTAKLVQGLAAGWGDPGIESRWRWAFPHKSIPFLGPHSLLHNRYRVSLPGSKRPGRDVDHLPHLAQTLKKVYSYTATLPLGLRGLFRVNFTYFVLRSSSWFRTCVSPMLDINFSSMGLIETA
jgi:hypothetical protein